MFSHWFESGIKGEWGKLHDVIKVRKGQPGFMWHFVSNSEKIDDQEHNK